jgi:hypothetical protein
MDSLFYFKDRRLKITDCGSFAVCDDLIFPELLQVLSEPQRGNLAPGLGYVH